MQKNLYHPASELSRDWNPIFESILRIYKKLTELGFTHYKRSLKASIEDEFSSSAYNGKVAIINGEEKNQNV